MKTILIINLMVSIVLVMANLVLLYKVLKVKKESKESDEIIVPPEVEKHLTIHFEVKPGQVN